MYFLRNPMDAKIFHPGDVMSDQNQNPYHGLPFTPRLGLDRCFMFLKDGGGGGGVRQFSGA